MGLSFDGPLFGDAANVSKGLSSRALLGKQILQRLDCVKSARSASRIPVQTRRQEFGAGHYYGVATATSPKAPSIARCLRSI